MHLLSYIYRIPNLSTCVSSLFSYFDFVDGPAEDLYGIFINRVRRERPPEFLEKIRGLVMTTSELCGRKNVLAKIVNLYFLT